MSSRICTTFRDDVTTMSDLELTERPAEVNERIFESASVTDDAPETLLFRCECGRCGERVPMTLAEYRVLQAAGEPVLAPGYELTTGTRVRRWSRKLRADARALQAKLAARSSAPAASGGRVSS